MFLLSIMGSKMIDWILLGVIVWAVLYQFICPVCNGKPHNKEK